MMSQKCAVCCIWATTLFTVAWGIGYTARDARKHLER